MTAAVESSRFHNPPIIPRGYPVAHIDFRRVAKYEYKA
jgi:hypothetical protein